MSVNSTAEFSVFESVFAHLWEAMFKKNPGLHLMWLHFLLITYEVPEFL